MLTSETEPNNTTATADDILATDVVDGTVASISDIDYFRINLAHGSRLRLSDFNFRNPSAALNVPPSIEILDDSGSVLRASRSGEDLEITANRAGFYFLKVTSASDFGIATGKYSFTVLASAFTGVTEQEPNDTRSSATALVVNQAFRGQLSSTDASDFYSLNLNARNSLFVNFNGPPEQRPGVRLWNSSGSLIASGLAGEGLAINVAAGGAYTIEVLDNSAAGQTEGYVGVAQVSVQADFPSDLGDGLDNSTAWVLGRENSILGGQLSTLNDSDVYAVSLTSLSRAEITLHVAGNEKVPTYGRTLIVYDRMGTLITRSRDGVLNFDRFVGSTPGEFLIQVMADSTAGVGAYGLRAWNFDDYSNQRDVPINFVDFTRQNTQYSGFNFVAPFGAPEAIPYITGFLESRFSSYDVDLTLTKPDASRYLQNGFGDFAGLNGGVGGGYYGFRRPEGGSANNAEATSWSLTGGAGVLVHEFGHAAGLPHARNISSEMSYVHTDQIIAPGFHFGFTDVNQFRPNNWIANDRNELDWNLASGAQIPDLPSDLNSPQEIDSNFREMSFELNESPQTYATQQTPTHLVSGDLNGDGWKDIVVSHSGTTLSVYLSDARGGFLAARNYTVNAFQWWNEAVTAADYNRDGRDDVAIVSRDQETLTVLLASADGTLVASANQSIGRWPQVIQSRDMNRDGFVDLVAANASNQVTIMRGRGDGTFLPAQSFNTGLDPNHLVLEDFNGDSRVDIATANYGSDTVAILLADASGGFNTVTTFSGGTVLRGMTGGDFDGDGDIDLATGNHSLRLLNVYTNRGDGLFDAARVSELRVYPENLMTTDLNQDGKLDIVASGNSSRIEVLLGMGNSTFSRPIAFLTPGGAVTTIPVDVNRDGRLDLATISFWENKLYVQTAKDDSPRNDRVVIYGDISSAKDVDAYSLNVAAGSEYSFDIDAAEFQYPLDSEIKVLNSSGVLLATSREAMDRESGLDSVDPYLVTRFTTAETIRIVVSSEHGTVGAYRLKVTPTKALKVDSPRVIAVVPDNRTFVDSTRQIVFMMDKAIDPTSMNSSNIVVRGAQTGVRSGRAFFDPLDGFLVWTADSVLPVDTYTVTLASGATGIRDMFGNPLDGEVPGDFKFPRVSGDGSSGGNFSSTFTVERIDQSAANLYYGAYQRDPSNRGRFELRWDDNLSFRELENAEFTLRGAGLDGQFDTADDRLQSMDAVYSKTFNVGSTQASVDAYSRGYPDMDLYRIEANLVDMSGNPVRVFEQINVGSSVPESALFTDSARTRSGLTGSYVNSSLRSVTSTADWRSTQTISGTRVDNTIDFRDSLGRRSDVGITGGTDDNWDNFSVQWDGWITIPSDGTRLQTRSDDGSRLWIDINKNSQFDTSELFDNGWGRGQGIIDGALTPMLAAGTYQIRVQYEEGVFGNRVVLEWIDPRTTSTDQGYINGPTVIGTSIQSGSVYRGALTNKLDVDFNGALDTTSLTNNNFRLRYSTDPTFFDGNDTFVQDQDGVIQWNAAIRRATFEAATALKSGYYLIELNGGNGGIRNTAGKLLDGEYLSNYIAGNTSILSPSRHVSGDGLPGGDYRAAFSVADALAIRLSADSLSENGGSVIATVMRNDPATSPLVLNLSSSDTSAVTVPASVTILAGSTSATFTVTAVDDLLADGNQTATLTATAAGYGAGTAQVTVIDDETATLTVSLTSSSIAENGGFTSGVVRRNTPTTTALTVNLSSSNLTAATVPASVTIPIGSSTATFTITAVNNAVADGDQTTTLTASSPGFASGNAQITVVDDEVATLLLAVVTPAIAENGGRSTVTVSRNTPTNSAQVVTINSSHPSFASVPSSVTIPAGSTSTTFFVSAINNSFVDGNQVVTVNASATGFVAASAQVTILEDDVATIAITLSATSVFENGGQTTATVTRNTPVSSALLVNLLSSDTNSATVPTTVTIPAGSASATFMISAVNDDIADGNQVVTITGSSINFRSGSAQITVQDDDAAKLTLTAAENSISENGGRTNVIVTRNTGTSTQLVVNLFSNPSLALQVPAMVTIETGQTTASFVVSAVNDSMAFGDQISTLTASANGLVPGILPITVIEDDVATFQLTLGASFVSENAKSTTVTVMRNTPVVSDLTVTLGSSDPTAATIPNSTMTIPAGSASATTLVLVTDDAIADGTQVAIISASANGFVTGTVPLNVVNDDNAMLSMSISASSLSENNGSATVTVKRNSPTTTELVVALSTNMEGQISIPESVTIPAGVETVSFTVTGVDNEIADGSRDVIIRAASQSHIQGTTLVSVTDDDVATLVLSYSPGSIAENGGTTTGRVTRNTPTTDSILVALAGDAQRPVGMPTFVTIPAGAGFATFSVAAINNAVADGTKLIQHSASSAGFVTGTAQLSIVDDEIATLVVNLSTTSITERGGTITGTVGRNTPTTNDLVVSLASSNTSLLTVPQSFVIPAGSVSANFTVTLVDNALAQGNALVDVIANAQGVVTGTASLQIFDDEVASLKLVLDANSIAEDGGSLSGILSRNTPDSQDLLVTLVSNEPTLVTVPSSVTIPRGANSASFSMSIIDNQQYRGDVTAVIVASASGLQSASSSLFVTEDEPQWPWHNARNPYDVNNDSVVSPVDALLVISYLNSNAPRQLKDPKPGDKAPPPFLDVSRDGMATPLDALLVISRLNRSGEAEGESNQTAPVVKQVFSDLDWIDNLFEQKRKSRR